MADSPDHRPFTHSSEGSGKWKKGAAFAVLSILWGSGWIAAGTPADQAPPLAMAAARFAVAAMLLLPVVLFKRLRLPGGRILRAIFVLSFTLIVLPTLLLVWGRHRASSEMIMVFFAAMPLIVVLVMSAAQGKSGEPFMPPRSAFYASLFGFGGIAFAVWNPRSLPPAAECAALLIAVISTAWSTVYAKRELSPVSPAMNPARSPGMNQMSQAHQANQANQANHWMSAMLQSGIAALLLALASAAAERRQTVQWSAAASEALLYLGVLSGAGYAIYFWLLKEFQAYQVATIEWITPFVALLESAILWRQRPSIYMVAGVAASLGSLLVVMRGRAEDDRPVSLRVTD